MHDHNSDAYPSDRFMLGQHEPIEWRRDIADPSQLFEREALVEYSAYVTPASEMLLGSTPMARGTSWSERVDGYGEGEHCLQAIVNVEGDNFGIAETVISGRSTTYITKLANNNSDKAELLGILDQPIDSPISFSLLSSDRSSRMEGHEHAAFSVRKAPDGTISIVNELLDPLRIGLGKAPEQERSFRERFSPRSVLSGLKRAILGPDPVQQKEPNKYKALIGTTNWMVSVMQDRDGSLAEFVSDMRQNHHTWYVSNPKETL
jgi:hypothetical protein